jgi:hypothetical protein
MATATAEQGSPKLPIGRNIALLCGAVAANVAMFQLTAAVAVLTTAAVVLVAIAALWILRGRPRRHALEMGNEGLRWRPRGSAGGWRHLEAT